MMRFDLSYDDNCCFHVGKAVESKYMSVFDNMMFSCSYTSMKNDFWLIFKTNKMF